MSRFRKSLDEKIKYYTTLLNLTKKDLESDEERKVATQRHER